MFQAGDLVTLTGDLGAGKTTFARWLIRSMLADPALEVPSPTFTLMQSYDGPRFPIVHADLYRIAGQEELGELGWEEAAEDSLVLVEWPERAGFLVTAERLDIALHLDPASGPNYRVAVLTGYGAWAPKVERAGAIHRLLASAGWSDAKREYLLGDASTRAYQRLTLHGETAILMISPKRADGPPVRMGKAYSTIAKLAESVHPFVGMTNGLRAQGLSAPAIIAQDLDTGLLLIEDLHNEPVIGDGHPIPERYAEAAALLAALHQRDLPTVLPVAEGREHAIPPDIEAMLIEVELLVDWYVPHVIGFFHGVGARCAQASSICGGGAGANHCRPGDLGVRSSILRT